MDVADGDGVDGELELELDSLSTAARTGSIKVPRELDLNLAALAFAQQDPRSVAERQQ